MSVLSCKIDARVHRRSVATPLAIIALFCAADGVAAAASGGRVPSRVAAFVTGSTTDVFYHRQQPINEAEARLVASCTQRKGFSLPQTIAPSLVPIPQLLQTESVASVPSEARELRAARRYGFGIAAGVEAERVRRRTTPPSPISLAEEEGLVGPPDAPEGSFLVKGIAEHTYRTTGCGPESYAALYGSPRIAAEADYYPEDLAFFRLSPLEQKVRLGGALRSWSVCFNKRTSPLKAANPVALRIALAKRELSAHDESIAALQAEERPVALSDLRCLYSSGYVEAEVNRARPIIQRVLRPYVGLLERLMKVDAHALSVAKAIIAK